MRIAIEENKFHGYVYDGIWAIALALDRVDYMLRHYRRSKYKEQIRPELVGLKSILDFEYHKPIWVDLIKHSLNKTRFNGVTVSIVDTSHRYDHVRRA